ncbi:MAG: CinA family protein [Alphaproteobacteria bacterium]|nr:CinA family protein [Alphaproteobacteria bacterium]
MLPIDIHTLAQQVVLAFTQTHRKLVLAESCTGGLIASALTDVPGASDVLERGFVTYSNEAKVEVLGVMPEMINRFGAVSKQVAEEMAQGALAFSHADVAVSVTGIAGPGGGSEKKPVGLVFFGLATRQGTIMHYKCQFSGNREEIRMQAVAEALKMVLPAA